MPCIACEETIAGASKPQSHSTDNLFWLLQLLSRLDSTAAVNQSMEALVHGDLHLPADGTYSISDALLPLYIPGEATSARRLWLADIFVALLQRAQVCSAPSTGFIA